jgi:hypothetical protein
MGGSPPSPPPPPPSRDYSANFAALASGQGTIRQDISGVNTNIQREADNINDNVLQGFRDQEGNFREINTGINDLGNDMSSGFANVGTQISGLGTDVGNQLDAFGSNMNTGLSNLGNQVGTGFNTLGSQVDTRFGELGNNMNTGFATVMTDMGQGFTTLGNNVNQGNQALMENQNTGFANVNQNVSNVGTNLGNQMTEMGTNVLGGQDTIRNLVEQYGGNLDNYYAALAQGQSEAAARQGAMQTGLDAFRNTYDKQTTLANQQRGRIQDAVAGGVSQIQEDLGNNLSATQQGLSNVQQRVGDVNSNVQQNATNMEKDFATVAKQITVGFDDGTQTSASMRNEFVDRLNTIRGVLSDQNANIDANIRSSYSQLANSFDQTGSLIQSSVDQSGNKISRAIDGQGNLLLATFNNTGAMVDQNALNINNMMSQLDRIGYRPGTNSGMMAMTGTQPAAVYSGLASPYAQTM